MVFSQVWRRLSIRFKLTVMLLLSPKKDNYLVTLPGNVILNTSLNIKNFSPKKDNYLVTLSRILPIILSLNLIFILCQYEFNHNSPNFHNTGESLHSVNGYLITFLQCRIFILCQW